MKRELPDRPNLEHLKSQAKDLLDAHRRGEPSALARIRAVVPAFARSTDDQIAEAPFALHDAQSAIAREYGFPSFAKLRAQVLVATQPYPTALLERLMGGKLPPELEATLREVWTKRDVETLDALPTPEELPVLAVRNALVSPGALAPLSIGRPSSLSALSRVTGNEPSLVALFAQQSESVEYPTADDLHRTGCLAIVRRFERGDGDSAWVVLEGIRWITLERLTAMEPFLVARIVPAEIGESDPSEVSELGHELRDAARRLARTLPEKDAALALIDQIDDTGRLSDLIIANLPCSVAEKAAYAAEPTLATRLRSTLSLVERELSKTA